METANRTKLKGTDIDVLGINKYLNLPNDIDVQVECSATLDFSLDIQHRQCGIERIGFIPRRVSGVVAWRIDAEDLTNEEKSKLIKAGAVETYRKHVEGEILVDTELQDTVWSIEHDDLQFGKNGSFQIDEMEILLPSRHIIIKNNTNGLD